MKCFPWRHGRSRMTGSVSGCRPGPRTPTLSGDGRTGMNARRGPRSRLGRCSGEYTVMLALIIVVCIAAVRLLSPEAPPEQKPLLDRVLAAALGLVQCFGLFVGLSFVLASLELAKQTAA